MSDEEIPIPAATVVLLRDAPELEVLMIERHANIGFAGGAMVFPGGRVDAGDAPEKWRALADGLNTDPALAAGQIASIREAYEETGILIVRDASGALIDNARAEALDEHRNAVEADADLFFDLMNREGLRLACDQLTFFAHWIAPPGLHRRFDTLFFAALTPPGQIAREDGNEATEAMWISPRDVLKARDAGERRVIYPTARNVELLAESGSAQAVIDFAGERIIEPITPHVATRDGVSYLTIPDHLGYPVIEEPLDRAVRQ